MPYLIAKLPLNFDSEGELENVTKALELLNELTELRELLEMCLEENTDYEGNTQSIRIKLLVDCYLSRSEYCVDGLRNFLERSRSSVATMSSDSLA